MVDVKFGAVIGIYSSRETVRLSKMAEGLGYDSIWIPDHLVGFFSPGSFIDPWTTLAAVGENTKSVFLSPSVTDCQRCHPAKIAHMVSTLDELSNGRAGLGIGAGEAMNIVPYGLEWEKPSVRVGRLREAVQVVKLLWGSSRDNPVNFEGAYYQLSRAWLDHKPVRHPHPPVYIGALGNERTLEIVGELGDGWLPWISCPESWKRRLEFVRRGTEKAKRPLKDLDLCVWMYFTMSEAAEAYENALNQLKRTLLVDRYHLRMFGYDLPLPIEYSYQRLSATEKAQKIIIDAAKQIPDELMEKKFIPVGGADEIIETISAYVKMGATHICVRDIFLSAEEGFGQFSKKVIPYFREQSN